ncbi:MAG TPA: bifunctional chorismate mutase/prephenate dehydrogenase [Acidobacteriota bacterium]|nr:bifunctional chorismate mutase/prephenate dehydrogenase [Acidobacteriota bacterium]
MAVAKLRGFADTLMAMDSLQQMRERLGEIDQEILKLVARRQELALEIGKLKIERGAPTRDYQQEKEVVERAKEAAADQGLPARLGEKLCLLLIEASLTAQEQERVSLSGEGQGQTALVIGGAGKMGRWMCRFLASQGYDVHVADPQGSPDGYPHLREWTSSPLDQDVIVVAAPMKVSREVLEKMAEDPPQGLIFDIGSLKSPLREALHKLAGAGAKVTSIHPMFGPDTDLLSRRHVIFVDVGVPRATEEARRLFESTMAVQSDADLESHDRLMAYVLGLSHALNIAFATALAESQEALPTLAQLSSTTFESQLEVAAKVSEDNPHMYFEIQSLNDYGTESLAALLYAVERVRSAVLAKDEKQFVNLMLKGRSYLKDAAALRREE